MNNLVIIPARAGSKGIKNKNIKELNGKPLITWTIEHALKSKLTNRVIVATDCEITKNIAIKAGAESPFLRPKSISDDNASTESVISFTLDYLKNNEEYIPDNIILLQCTSPIRKNGRLDECIKKFNKRGFDSMLSVTKFWHFIWEKHDNNIISSYDFMNRPRRQDIKSIKFKENGSIYITKLDNYMISKNRLSGNIGLFEMEEFESFEIDTTLDWKISEEILRSYVT